MKNRYLARVIAPVLACAMALLTACGSNKAVDNTKSEDVAVTETIDADETQTADDASNTSENEADDATVSDETTTAEETADAGDENSAADENGVDEDATGEAVIDEEWEMAKTSGLKSDYEKYFEVDVNPYFQTNDSPRGTTETISYYSEQYGMDREAYVYTPADYDPAKKYPVVYVIHGIGCDGGQWVSMGAGKMIDGMVAMGEIEPVIAVFPSVIPPEGINPNTLSNENIAAFSDFTTELVNDLHPYMLENYSINESRETTGVCGLSMGGMEALRLGFSLQEMFNYIGSFSAAPTLELELLKVNDPEVVPELVLVCSGDADGTVGENPMNYHLELEKNGVDHIWYQHPGGGHAPSVWNLGFYNFMTRAYAIK